MPVDSKVGRRHWGWLILLVTFWKFQHFNLVSKIFQKLFKPLPCHKSIGKMLHAICISAVAVSLRWASCGPWASCCFVIVGSDIEVLEKQISQRLIWAYNVAMLLSRVLRLKALLPRSSKLLPIYQEGEVTSPLISGSTWTLRLQFTKYQQSNTPMKFF